MPLTRNIVAIVLVALLVVTVIVPIVAIELWTIAPDIAVIHLRDDARGTPTQREPLIAQSPLRGPPFAHV